MKSHANKTKLNELFSLLNADRGGHSNSLENACTYIVKLDAILTKLGGKNLFLNLIIGEKNPWDESHKFWFISIKFWRGQIKTTWMIISTGTLTLLWDLYMDHVIQKIKRIVKKCIKRCSNTSDWPSHKWVNIFKSHNFLYNSIQFAFMYECGYCIQWSGNIIQILDCLEWDTRKYCGNIERVKDESNHFS